MKAFAALCLLVWPATALADGYGFMTPSGNIFCNGAVEVSEISCTLAERSGPPALPRPASCTATWGHSYTLQATGGVTMVCSGPPSRVNYTDIAPYGVTGRFGAITCQSESSGLTCVNASGHGFSLSRGRQQVF